MPPTKLPKVARLLLAGRPLPRIEDTVKIGEVFRRAVMARIKGEIPAVISGRDADGKASHDPQHSHAFFLPEDHDRDGFIDHLVLYIRDGLPPEVANALDNLRSLWISASRRDPEDPARFFIYEQYADEAAYTAHTETEHFQRLGFGDAIPRLLERKREFYVPMVN